MKGIGIPEKDGWGLMLRGSDYWNEALMFWTLTLMKAHSWTPAIISSSNSVSVMVTSKLTLENTYWSLPQIADFKKMSLFHHTHCSASLAAVTVFLGTQGLITRDMVTRPELTGLLGSWDNKWLSGLVLPLSCPVCGWKGSWQWSPEQWTRA